MKFLVGGSKQEVAGRAGGVNFTSGWVVLVVNGDSASSCALEGS